MPNNPTDEFAKLLIENVRDSAIQGCDLRLDPEARSVMAKQWKELVGSDGEAAAKVLIADCVDEAIFHLLNALDNKLIQLSFQSDDGTVSDLTNDGELAGSFIGDWRKEFSKERFNDYSAGTSLEAGDDDI